MDETQQTNLELKYFRQRQKGQNMGRACATAAFVLQWLDQSRQH
jgi:hypothetical protein